MSRIGERRMHDVSIRMGGPAGAGIKAAGQALARTFMNEGLYTFDLTEYPSLIRGGHNVITVRVGPEEFHSHASDVDILVALNQETAERHLNALVEGAAIVYDPDSVSDAGWPEEPKVRRVPIPLDRFALEAGGTKIMRNTVANAAVLGLLRFPLEPLAESLKRQFAHKAPEIAEQNVTAATSGYEEAARFATDFPLRLDPVADPPERILVDGNEAVGLGALAAGIGLYAAYPMTPASTLLHFMAAHDKEGVVVKHTEDEIAAMNMVVGAAFGGGRAMCATSGGGFSLMVEAFGLAGVSESAVVVGVFGRPGPATGLPTWTEQGDLRFVLHAAQGEFPRVLLAPGDRTDAFELAWAAFNLADQLQTPVAILGDTYLSDNRQSVLPFDSAAVTIDRGKLQAEGEVEDYLRYRVTDDGVSLRALPGVKGALQVVNSYEHDEYGYGQEGEKAEVRIAQDEKRLRKLDLARTLVPPPARFGPDEAEVSVITWGSCKGPVLDAMDDLAAEGIAVNMLQLRTLWPFPADEVAAFLGAAKKSLVVEGNATGQMESLIRQECLLVPDERLHRYDGRPFSHEQVAAKIREVT